MCVEKLMMPQTDILICPDSTGYTVSPDKGRSAYVDLGLHPRQARLEKRLAIVEHTVFF